MPRRLPTLLFLLLPALLFPLGCRRTETAVEAANRTGTLLVGNGAEPADLDPHTVTAFTDMNIMVALFEGLTVLDEATSEPRPGVAESWDISSDGLVWTFKLRANARWSDGTPVTAGDFVYSFRRILAPKLAAEYAYMLWPLKNAQAFNEGRLSDPSQIGAFARDDRTLVLTLAEACPWLLTLVSNQAWFPVQRATIERFGASDQRGTRWTRPENFMGNGPFLLREWTPNARLVVERNPHYWDLARCTIKSVVFFPNENLATDERNFRTGQLHATYDLPPEKIASYRQSAPAQLRIDPFYETFFLRFNTTRAPFDRPEIRRALALAIDREALCRTVLKGSRVPAFAYTPPGAAGYVSEATLSHDPARARQLLEAAGYPNGQGLPSIEVELKSDDIHRAVMEAVQQMWLSELGVKTTLSPLEQKTWLAHQQAMSFQVSSGRWIGDFLDPSTFLELFLSGSGKNQTGWKDLEFDRLVSTAARTGDTATRKALQQKAEARLLEAAPIAPVFHGARVYLLHPSVGNWPPALLGLRRYQYVTLTKGVGP